MYLTYVLQILGVRQDETALSSQNFKIYRRKRHHTNFYNHKLQARGVDECTGIYLVIHSTNIYWAPTMSHISWEMSGQYPTLFGDNPKEKDIFDQYKWLPTSTTAAQVPSVSPPASWKMWLTYNEEQDGLCPCI